MISLLLPIFLYSVVFKMFWKQYIQSIAYDHFVFHVSLKVPFRQEMLWLMQICIEKLHPFDLTRNKRKYLKASWNKLAYDFVFPFHFVFFFFTHEVLFLEWRLRNWWLMICNWVSLTKDVNMPFHLLCHDIGICLA